MNTKNQINIIKPRTRKQPSFANRLLDFAITFFVITLSLTQIIALHAVPTGSMDPFIPRKTVVACWQLSYLFGDPTPKRGDIVSFTDPDDPSRKLIKRVIGLPGDVITFDQGYVYLNDEKLDEPYLVELGTTYSRIARFEVPEGCFFAMGDNRTHSYDCREKPTHYIPIDTIYARWLFNLPSFFWCSINE